LTERPRWATKKSNVFSGYLRAVSGVTYRPAVQPDQTNQLMLFWQIGAGDPEAMRAAAQPARIEPSRSAASWCLPRFALRLPVGPVALDVTAIPSVAVNDKEPEILFNRCVLHSFSLGAMQLLASTTVEEFRCGYDASS
jgi:hypothetical protein